MKLWFALFSLAMFAVAQTPSASVVGRVTDPTGAVVPGVTVKVTNVETNISHPVSTNETGEYTAPFLNPGKYILEASAAGYRSKRGRCSSHGGPSNRVVNAAPRSATCSRTSATAWTTSASSAR